MGCLVEYGHDGRQFDVHIFDNYTKAVQYLTIARRYTFVESKPFRYDSKIDYFQGPDGSQQRASLRNSSDRGWICAFWEEN